MVPLTSARYKRRLIGQLIQKIQHVASSLPLLFDGLHRASGFEWRAWTFWLGTAELATGVIVLAAFVLAVRAVRRATAHDAPGAAGHAHHGPDWLDVFLGVMLAVEVLVHYEETGHWRRPMILLSVATLIVGVFHGQIAAWGVRKRSLKVTDTGLVVPRRFFRTLKGSWPELDRIDITPASAQIVTRRGRVLTLTFSDLLRGGDVREALEVAKAKLAEYKNTTDHAQTDPSSGRRSSGGQQAETH